MLVHSERSGLARFAGSTQHQPTLRRRHRRHACARFATAASASRSTNRTSDDGLREVAARAADAAGAFARGSRLPRSAAAGRRRRTVDGYDEETAALGPDEQARLAAAAIAAAGDIPAYGFFTSGVDRARGRVDDGRRGEPAPDRRDRARARRGRRTARATRRRPRRRSRASIPRACAAEAAEKAARTSGARELEPGDYRAVLEPYALGELLQYFAWDSFGAPRPPRGAQLPRRAASASASSTRRSRSRTTRSTRAACRRRSTSRASPKQRVTLVEDGVARGVVWDRRTAKRAGGDAHGDGPRAAGRRRRRTGRCAFALSLAGGDADSRRRARRDGRRRHLHHARPLPRHRRPARAACSRA